MTRQPPFRFIALLATLFSAVALVASAEPLPFQVPAGIPDAAALLPPGAVHIDGWLGRRIEANADWLLKVDTEPMLAGFRKRPGSHPWIGEHVGKWLHTATLAWAYTDNPALRRKLDRVAAELIRCQEPDGYLGTYVPEKRFGLDKGADWDVWSHKYCLIGLLTYHRYTGNDAALAACRKIGDLLAATFPAKKSILAAGTHVGMAATSVLEPVVLLYRSTGERRYLEFAQYLVKSWDEPGGPKIVATLLAEKRVDKTANGKAYEMLSNLVGLCELARATGDRKLLEPVFLAWTDVVANRLYLTGGASSREHFQDDHVLPNRPEAHVGETCVTTTWIQLNLQLLQLTGQARFADELERSCYNHLAAAQHPAGEDWCYYTALEGRKPYDKHITCCHSSGPRGMALAPLAAYLLTGTGDQPELAVNTFETSCATFPVRGQAVTLQQQSEFPRKGLSVLTLKMAEPATFGLRLRVPVWAAPLEVCTRGQSVKLSFQDGWARIPARRWQSGERITLQFRLEARLIDGQHGNAGLVAAAWGPLVLAYDEARNPGLSRAARAGLAENLPPRLVSSDDKKLAFAVKLRGTGTSEPAGAMLSTFADAGADGGAYRVWLRSPGAPPETAGSLLLEGRESRSRRGNQFGSIIDDDPSSFAVTFDGRKASEDWFAVTLDSPVAVRRVEFAHGRSFHDGGWFDSREGRPRVEVLREKGGRWETVGTLNDYPATTATDNKNLTPGQKFTLRLPQPVKAFGVRVIGSPACGDNPHQAFSSCAELEAFAD